MRMVDTPQEDKAVLKLRAQQFVERKTEAILFRKAVRKELRNAGVDFLESYCQPPYSTDFLVKSGRMSIVVDCHANVMRDLAKTIACARLVKNEIGGNLAMVAVPYAGENSSGQRMDELDVEVVEISLLGKRILEVAGAEG